jgi:hypothetical protein
MPGIKWWEIDLTWMVIRLLMLLGLARDVAVPLITLAAKSSASDRRSPLPGQEYAAHR